MANADLPDQIVHELLTRLPVKTLLRCKAVCKSWLSLISSSYFVKTHLSVSTNDPHCTHHHLLSVYLLEKSEKRDQLTNVGFCKFRPNREFESHSVYSLLNEPVTEAIKIGIPFEHDFPGFEVIGCCNGIICFKSGEPMSIFFWNPSTRKIRRLPKLIHAKSEFPLPLGFCYDESTDDFKLFSVCSHDQKVSVYSSKSNSWKRIGDFPLGEVLEDGIFADGAVHWVSRKQNTPRFTIVSVDIKKETFTELVLPTKNAESIDCWRILDTFGKSLSVVNCWTHDIWVLKERDVKESWTKVFTIPTDIPPINRFNPLCICVNGDILLNLDATIRLYDSKENALKVLKENHKALYTYTYVESLVSP